MKNEGAFKDRPRRSEIREQRHQKRSTLVNRVRRLVSGAELVAGVAAPRGGEGLTGEGGGGRGSLDLPDYGKQ